MSNAGSFTDAMDAAERRRRRAELARERVASGTTTARPAASQPLVPRRGAAERPRPVPGSRVDPALAPGAAYGVWRSPHHFCTADAVPDAVSTDLDRLVRWSGQINAFRLRRRLIARLDAQGVWHPVAYAKDGRVSDLSHGQAERLAALRAEPGSPASIAGEPGGGALDPGDHPEVTVSL